MQAEGEHQSKEIAGREFDAKCQHDMELWRASNAVNLEGTGKAYIKLS